MIYRTLVDGATLAANLDDPEWCVVDVRHALADPQWGERAYADGHIPGAQFLHCDRDLSGPMNGRNGRHPLPEPERLRARLMGLGVVPGRQVVVYDDAQGMIAGRLWYLLRGLGHEAVAVLDGGWQAWIEGGRPQSKESPSMTNVEAPATVSRFASVVGCDELLAALGSPTLCLVDARSPDRFRGENETLDPVGGHIPGAVNRFFRDNLAPDGRFKSAEMLRTEWLALLNGREPAEVIHQCGSGVSACHNLLAMEIAGLSGSRLYAGSWSEWCSDLARPMVTGV